MEFRKLDGKNIIHLTISEHLYKSSRMCSLSFFENRTDISVGNMGTLIVEISSKIIGKERLLKELYEKLNFPEYFGFNWDSLDECLNNFEWESASEIVIIHNELPVLNAKDFCTYIRILDDAVLSWRQSNILEIKIYFPSKEKLIILDCLGSGSVSN